VSHNLINYGLVSKESIINMFEVVLKIQYLVVHTVLFIGNDNRNSAI